MGPRQTGQGPEEGRRWKRPKPPRQSKSRQAVAAPDSGGVAHWLPGLSDSIIQGAYNVHYSKY